MRRLLATVFAASACSQQAVDSPRLYPADPTADPPLLRLAAPLAVWTLARHGIPLRGLDGARVDIEPVVEWADPWGRGRVGGFAFVEQRILVVGCDVASLAHEMLHLVQWYEEGTIEDGHQTWGDRGWVDLSLRFGASLRDELRGAGITPCGSNK